MNAPNVTLPARWDGAQYQLLDFGDGRKLEQFGSLILDRSCPAALEFSKREKEKWSRAHVLLDEKGKVVEGQPPKAWETQFGRLRFELRITAFGHVGVFPEQYCNWHWLSQTVGARPNAKALNLFGYTGGTTQALAGAGAQVVHVDAAAPSVTWARHNAQRAGMEALPIRWIVEDARKFVSREIRRGNQYDVVVLDPPSYGHGPTGKSWKIENDLWPLLDDCLQLLSQSPSPVLLFTAHSLQPNEQQIAEAVAEHFGDESIAAGRMLLSDSSGRALDAGYFVRCARAQDSPLMH